MAIFIDSADASDIRSAADLGWVSGITTNPTLLAQAGADPAEVLQALSESRLTPIFYQLIAPTLAEMHREAAMARDILEERLVLKLPPSELGFRFASEEQLIPCCPTAIFDPAQALLAREAGARYIAVYINRASRLMGDGLQLLEQISKVLDGSETEILAASLKNRPEVIAAHLAGAQHLTMPLAILRSLHENEHSRAALDSFNKKGVGLEPK